MEITCLESNDVDQPTPGSRPTTSITLFFLQDAAPNVLAATKWALSVSSFGVDCFHVDYGKLMLYNSRCRDFGFNCDLPLQEKPRRSFDEDVRETGRCPPVR